MLCTPVFLPGESPRTEEPGGPQSMGSQRIRHDGVTKHSTGSGSVVKNPPALREIWAWSLGRRPPGKENGNPLQYSYLENPLDRAAWWAAVHGVTMSRTRLITHAQTSQTLHILNCAFKCTPTPFPMLLISFLWHLDYSLQKCCAHLIIKICIFASQR